MSGGARGNEDAAEEEPVSEPVPLRQPEPGVLVPGLPRGRDFAVFMRMHLHRGPTEEDRNHLGTGMQIVAVSTQVESQGKIKTK